MKEGGKCLGVGVFTVIATEILSWDSGWDWSPGCLALDPVPRVPAGCGPGAGPWVYGVGVEAPASAPLPGSPWLRSAALPPLPEVLRAVSRGAQSHRSVPSKSSCFSCWSLPALPRPGSQCRAAQCPTVWETLPGYLFILHQELRGDKRGLCRAHDRARMGCSRDRSSAGRRAGGGQPCAVRTHGPLSLLLLAQTPFWKEHRNGPGR